MMHLDNYFTYSANLHSKLRAMNDRLQPSTQPDPVEMSAPLHALEKHDAVHKVAGKKRGRPRKPPTQLQETQLYARIDELHRYIIRTGNSASFYKFQ